MLSSRATMLLLFEGSVSMSDTVIIGILTIAASCLVSWLTTRSQAAEWKGEANQKFVGIAKDLNDIDTEQDNQWREIRKATNGVARLDGEMSVIRANNRSKHAGQS